MATMQFDLVSPERSLASLDVTAVQIPGADGDMTAMADHAPTITTLRPEIGARPQPAQVREQRFEFRTRRLGINDHHGSF